MASPACTKQPAKRMKFVCKPLSQGAIEAPIEATKNEGSKESTVNGAAVENLKDDGKWQLRDGVPSSAYRVIHKRLKELRLWSLVSVKQDSHDEVDPKVKAELERNDPWAVTFMLQYITENFLIRSPTEKPEAASEIFESLNTGLAPFRFEDLPRELRLNVYGCMVPIRQENSENCGINMIRRPRIVNVASKVSPEFEEEALKFYYSYNKFEEWCDRPEELQDWASLVGMKHLRHLRDLKVTFTYYKGFFDTFHVTYSPSTGLKAAVYEYYDYDPEPQDEAADELVTMINRRKKDEKWNSTGVIEFFTLDPEALRNALYGQTVLGEDEDEEIDERDAYQVAYGRPIVRVSGCPW